MKAVAVLPDRKSMELIDHPPPALSEPTQVLLRTLEVGVCGTDKEIAQFLYGQAPAGDDYLIIGHECLAEVAEIGASVHDLQVGDLVVPTVRRPCSVPPCVSCVIGRQDFCYSGEFLERGIKGAHGFMSEYFVEERRYLHRVPRSQQSVAVLTEPLSISQKALRQILSVQDRLPWSCSTTLTGDTPVVECRTALVLGAGAVGLLGAMTLIDAGFNTIVYSRSQKVPLRAQLARELGARFIPAEEIEPRQLLHEIGKVDVVFEAVGASQLAFEILELLGPNAIFVFTGIPGHPTELKVNTGQIMRNLVLMNQALIGTVNAGPEDFEGAVSALDRFARHWPGALEKMKTGSVAPEEAVSLLRENSAGIKTTVRLAP